ncbi:alpha/beta hydrolase [Curtobacterium sp. VKM Ac-2887]|uniref:alpha/beta hydrolase n=1 Tax=Curtobacterium sp. VKM Ac-2887 TaxID=2783819 RepID=UPI002B27B608|nr:alpha/beta hydrolase [Curtobacterium sp. VKM Ac-2887]
MSEAAQQWLQLPPSEQPMPELDDTAAWLQYIGQIDAFVQSRFLDATLPVTSQSVDVRGVPTYIVRPAGLPESDTGPIYLNLHGGALVLGGGELAGLMASGVALSAGMTTWSVDYRMPPLHPYPAALDDCIAVYRALLEIRRPEEIFVGGGSAGGNLAAALMLRAHDEGLPMPAALVLTTPEVDLTESGDTFQTLDGVDNILSSCRQQNLLYAAGHDLADPYLSPLFGDVAHFPPTFLQSGTRDLFLSNTVRMHRKLRNAGVEAELHVFEAMPHGGFGGSAPEDQDLSAEIRRFVDRHRSDER